MNSINYNVFMLHWIQKEQCTSCPFHGKAYHVIEWEFLLYINFASGGKVELPYINHNITMIKLRA